MSLSHRDVIEQLAASMSAAAHRMGLMTDALRDVQLLNSRALIELPPALASAIDELIGVHPRDEVRR